MIQQTHKIPSDSFRGGDVRCVVNIVFGQPHNQQEQVITSSIRQTMKNAFNTFLFFADRQTKALLSV